MAEDDDVNYSEIKFAQSGDGAKQERKTDAEVIYSNVACTDTDKEECVYSTVRPHQGGGSESGVSAPQDQPKPKDPSPITRSKVKDGSGACRRSIFLLLMFLLLSLLGITVYLGAIHVSKRNSLYEVEQSLTGSLAQLKSLQNDKENLTTHLREQEIRHNNESFQLQNELKEVKQNLHDQLKNYTALSGAHVQLQNTFQDVRTKLDQKSISYNNLLREKEKLQRDLRDVHEEAWEKFSAGWNYFKGSYYFFSTDKKNWADSRDACVTMGGHLVIIETEEEQDFLKRNSDKTDYWIGLTDSAKEGEWRWVDNKLLNDNKKFWHGREPDNWKGNQRNPGEDCARFGYSTGRNTWYDAFCTDSKNYMCESIAAKHN